MSMMKERYHEYPEEPRSNSGVWQLPSWKHNDIKWSPLEMCNYLQKML